MRHAQDDKRAIEELPLPVGNFAVDTVIHVEDAELAKVAANQAVKDLVCDTRVAADSGAVRQTQGYKHDARKVS